MTMTFIILAALALALGLRYATGFRASTSLFKSVMQAFE